MYRSLIPEVMSHGDVWMNNIFFLKDESRSDQLTDQVAAFVDWQVASSGCGLNDVVRVAI
uniref:Aminoglycoside phosphotransferase domain-containing protein n=1 Tax=Romanomermis culicivorax TaxID=13658 RepID=A0A915KZ74_ROMCU